jgi:hypothetical protein
MGNMKQPTDRDNEMLEKLKHGTSYDRIYGHYIYPDYIELTEKEIELRDRWAFAWTALLNNRLTGTAVNMLKEEYEISESQAYKDIKNARKLFGNVNETTKQAERNFLSELALKTYHEAALEGNFAQMNKAITNLIKLKQLDQEEPDSYDEENMKSNNYYMVLNLNNQNIKIDFNELDNLDQKEKQNLAKLLECDIDEVEATRILKS